MQQPLVTKVTLPQCWPRKEEQEEETLSDERNPSTEEEQLRGFAGRYRRSREGKGGTIGHLLQGTHQAHSTISPTTLLHTITSVKLPGAGTVQTPRFVWTSSSNRLLKGVRHEHSREPRQPTDTGEATTQTCSGQ